MKLLDLQREDHARLESLMHLLAEEPAAARAGTFVELLHLVTTHAFAEEEVLFPAARRALREGEPLTSEIELKHQRVNELLLEMEHLRPDDPRFLACEAELFPLLRSDVREEEDVLLPRLEVALGHVQVSALASAWQLAKKAAPNRSHPEIARRPPGNVLAGIPLFFLDRLRSWISRLRPVDP